MTEDSVSDNQPISLDDGHEPESEEYDLKKALTRLGYRVHMYRNGLTLAVRLEKLPSTRGVHVNIMYVLDLRRAEFGRSVIALKSQVLDIIDRQLPETLRDVGLDSGIDELKVRTPLGSITVPLFTSGNSARCSTLYSTKTVYVVTTDVRPSLDLSWLTDSSRIVTADGFVSAINSDNRSLRSDMYDRLVPEKWDSLKCGVQKGWYGFLSLIFGLVSLLSLIVAIIYASSMAVLPLMASLIGTSLAAWMMRESRFHISSFKQCISDEMSCLAELTDAHRIEEAIESNKATLKLIRDTSFIVSPLIISAAEAVTTGQTERTVLILSSILDECVYIAPNMIKESDVIGDGGLERFVSLFKSLYAPDEDEVTELALIYSDVTSHYTTPLNNQRLIAIIGQFCASLFNAGLIDTDTRDAVYELLNHWSMAETLHKIESELASPEESAEPLVEKGSEVAESVQESDMSESEEYHDFLEEIRQAGVDEDISEAASGESSSSKAVAREGT